ncbi:MAG: hypothetical protein JST87_05255 [Bacteroidetes bacterium]|nr:hypothetical protein [Bacteroidota bacterium]
MTAAEAIRRLDSFDIETTVIASMQEAAADFKELNEDQWRQGLRKDGSSIEPYPYSKPYAKKRQKAGLQTDHIDVNFTGNLYRGYKVEFTPQSVNMTNGVDYEKYVSKRYELLYGLSEENRRKFLFENVWPNLKPKIIAQGLPVK